MRPASSARHTHSLQQQRRRRQQLHVGRRLRPAAATALAKKQEPAETAAATPLRRGAGRAASRRTSAHLRAALPLRSPPRSPPAVRCRGRSGAEPSGAGCPAGALPGRSAARSLRSGSRRGRRQRSAAPLRYPGAGSGGRAGQGARCVGGLLVSPRCVRSQGERRARAAARASADGPLRPEEALRPPGRAQRCPRRLPEPRCPAGRAGQESGCERHGCGARGRGRSAERQGKGAPVSRRRCLPGPGAAPWALQSKNLGKQRGVFASTITPLRAAPQGGEGPFGFQPSHWVLIRGGARTGTGLKSTAWLLAPSCDLSIHASKES